MANSNRKNTAGTSGETSTSGKTVEKKAVGAKKKPATRPAAEKKESVKKEPVKKEPVKKETAKKAAARKAPAKKVPAGKSAVAGASVKKEVAKKEAVKNAPEKKAKKKKRTSSDLHRQVQDSLQALPYVIEQQKEQGHPVRAFMIRFLSGPVLKVMNKALSAKRYRGKDGEKMRQMDQMRRHLDQKGAALKQVQAQIQSQQRRRKTL